MNRKTVIIIIVAILAIIIVGSIIGNSNKKNAATPNTTIEDNKATSTVKVEEIEIKDITKIYESGVTTIRAKMYNRTTAVKNVTIKIILKEENGAELKNMVQVVENLQPNREKVLSTGIAGDYSKVSNITFEVVK